MNGSVMIAHHKLNVEAAPHTLYVLVGVITVCADARAGAQCMCRDVNVVNKVTLTKELRHLFCVISKSDTQPRRLRWIGRVQWITMYYTQHFTRIRPR